jgi:thiamine-monophosphate kinase
MNRKVLDRITENRLLSHWGDFLSPAPTQLNRPHEADADILPIPGSELCLALTIDTVSEEIAAGLYRDPETIGWMGATVSLSDLAAVGAEPLGLSVSVSLPSRGEQEAFQAGVARGLEAACRRAGTHVHGGDTNFAETPTITACAAGLVRRSRLLTRLGARPGNVLYASGGLGLGAACAAKALLKLPDSVFSEDDYRPQARVAEARMLPGHATCCMDTSDGLLATLDQLARLNGVGFELEAAPETLLAPKALAVCQKLSLPPLAMLAAHHGEFELVFTVREEGASAFEACARENGFAPLRLGRVLAPPRDVGTREKKERRPGEPEIRVPGRAAPLDMAKIRCLLDACSGDLKVYLDELLRLTRDPGSGK